MPHQCTDCGRTFDDGSQEMLSGCPDCGGNKFQYKPADAAEADDAEPPSEEPPEPPEPPVDSSVARTVGNAATAVRDFVGSSPSPDESPAGAPERASEATTSSETPVDAGEDTAQASARTDVVSKEELPPAPETPATADRSGASVDAESRTTESGADRPGASVDAESRTTESGADRPDLSELRDELNDQFESIKVLDPGKYELNLMELYDREEYIIALQEDGKYTIQVPERWNDD